MISDTTQVDALLVDLIAREDNSHHHVLDVADKASADCEVRRQLRQYAARYTQAVTSRVLQVDRRKSTPHIDWQHLDIHNSLTRKRFSQPGYDVVLLSTPPEQPELWLELLKPGGWLLCGEHQQWQRWQAPDEEQATLPFALTDIQHAYWIGRSQSLALGGVSCHVYFEWRIVDFDIVVFEAAWNRVIARHGMMRACVDDNGQQRILQRVPYYTITHDDMRGLSRQQRAEQLAYTRQRMCHQVLDASHWPLFELRISQEDDHHSRVHLDLDLLTFDVQSFHIVLSELERFYHQPQLNLPEIRYSFRDYQLAQMQTRSSQAWRDDRAWWLARLENLWPAPQLPLACQPADVERPTFRRLQRRIEPARWQQLSQQASQQGITPSAMLLAVFSELLALWCEEPQFTLNLTHFNRRPYHPEVAQLVGDFTSVLLLSIDCQEPLSFRDRALAIQHMLWERLAHSQFGGVDVLRELAKRQGKADSSAMPIVFTSLLGMDLDTLIEGADLLGEPEFLYTATPQVWLDHQVMVRKGSLEYNWIVIDELFPAGMSDALFTQYGELLDRLTDDHQCWLHPLDVPLTREQHQIRTAANNTDVALPLMPLHGAFFDQVQQQPDAIALIADGEQWDYRQLAQQALRVAARLNQLHCSGKPVIVSLPKSAGQIIATLGVMASGAILVPVDSDWPLARLHEVIVQSGAVALIAAQACLVSCPMINGVTLHELPDEPASVQLPDLNQVAYIIYTSGSTGKPKGVAMQHAATANTLSDVSGRLQLAPSDRVFGISALSFDLAIFDVFATLGAGASLVLPQQQGMRDAAHWWQLLQQHRITCWNSVPSLLAMLLEYGKNEGETLPCLRAIMLSGDWIGKDLVSAIPKLAPAARIIAMGGATEAAIWSNWFDVDPHQVSGHTVPYGYPLANQRYYVLDTQGRDRPAGVAGDLFIAGSGLAIGYWRDSKRTDAAFIHHSRSGERLYRTGDLARYDQQGCIEFLGRRDTQVKIGGYRIELGEIETAILAQQGVQAAVADVVTTNSGGQQLAAWVVLQTRCSDTTPLRHAGRLAADQLPDTTRLASLCAFQAESEALAPLMMLQILQQLEFCQPQGWEIGTRLTALHIAPRFNRLLTHWHESLEKEGWLAQDKGGWRMDLSTPTTLALAQRLDDGKHRLRQFLSWLNDGARFADWLFASADAIGSVLREPQLASSLLFPEGDSKASEALYQGNIIADYLGNIAAQLLKTALSGSDAPRVLEIGAGIGGLTASTLPVFAQLTVQGEYFHTDVSPWFTHYAEDRFGEYTQLRTGRYDINQRAIQQDYAAQTFEAILAANVLHNAHQLAQTLSDIWLILKPGGCLILLEATQDKQLQWVTAAAVLEHAAEGGNPQGDSPLLSEAAWRRALTLAGFELIESWPQAGTPMAFTGQHIFLARRPETVATPQQLQQGIAARLPAYMLPEHLMALAALPLSANGKIDRKQLPPPLLMSRHQTQCFSPPQTLTEQRLAIIWCELLQVKQVGREEDFFMAGGDSLLATRLVTCINSEWKIRVPIRLVFTHTQLQAMANALDASTQPTLTPPLVELSDDCCDKLLCFHASDGFALAYQQLATALTPGLQTLGVQACGLLPGEVPISSLEEQVQKVLKALPQPSISGRLHLTGWSMGVYLAMEAAYQLQRQGVQIASLILIDPAPQKAMVGCAASEYALWSSMADSTLRRHITSFSMMDEKEKLSNWRRVLPVGLTLEDPELSRLIAVIRANVQAMVTAPQRSLDIPLHIISASERDAEWGTAREALEGWFTRPPRQYCIEGSNHLNIITQPALFSVMQRITQG